MRNTVHKICKTTVFGLTMALSGCYLNDNRTPPAGYVNPYQTPPMQQQAEMPYVADTQETMLYERTTPPAQGISQANPNFASPLAGKAPVAASSHTKTTARSLSIELAEVEEAKTKLQEQIQSLEEQQKALEERKEKVEKKMAVEEETNGVKDWVASEGATLRGLLTQWADESGWRLIWNMDRDYTLSAGATFRGRFTDVSAALLRSFARAVPAPKGVFYKGNKVLVISTREDENAE